MKKLKTILITLLFAGFSTVANAEFKGGVTVTGLDATGTGKEMSRGVEQKRGEDLKGAFASFFIEKGFDTPVGSMAIGLDVSPYDIAEGAVANVRSGTNGAVLQTNTADVSVTENYGAYLTMGLGDSGAYIKAMVSSHNLSVDKTDIKNGDVTQTNSTYPDVDFLGGHVSIGFEKDMGDMFIRGEVGASEYEKVESKSSSGNTTVSARISNGTHARISLGKAF
tara:strand:+ start:168 stop:836 length:669 start_codon:yes stop_codon:yes gene_type:complete